MHTYGTRTFSSLYPIDVDWSSDKKYRAVSVSGGTFLLRVMPLAGKSSREKMFRIQRRIAELGVPMCEPLAYGNCPEGYYVIQRWINGTKAENTIPYLPKQKQYEWGLEAGRLLKKIHSIPAPEGTQDWESRYSAKLDRITWTYRLGSLHFEGSDDVLAYIEENRHLLANRPQCFHHGDYHIGNMMIEEGHLAIIDFDQYDFGDPWEEFNRIIWSAQTIPHFATGMVDGYFDGEVPLEFWQLLALYICSNTLSSISWTRSFGEREVRTMLKQAQDVLNWYDYMKYVIPTWYQR